MVGIVLVSHSRPLAEAAKHFVQAMTGSELPLAIAAGAGENRADLGTDATEILAAIQSVMSEDGALVLMDLGSAILSAETALEFLDEDVRSRVRLCAAPLVEGALAAGVTAKLGSKLEQVLREAEQALLPKRKHLSEDAAAATADTTAPPRPTPAATAAPTASSTVKIRNVLGMHARPAALFVQKSATFDAEINVENTTLRRGPVSAKSLSALAMLEAAKDHQLRITASGPQAKEAVSSLCGLVESGLGDTDDVVSAAIPMEEAKPAELGRAQPIAEGIAIGRALLVEERPVTVPQHSVDDPQAEIASLERAIEAARGSLKKELQSQAPSKRQQATIFEAQAVLLDDPVLVQGAREMIVREKANAALAWHRSITDLAKRYRELTDPYLRQRAADVEDVGRRVLSFLGIKTESELPKDANGILVVGDLTPTQAAQLSPDGIAGVVCLDGGRTSHSAILLRAVGIPSVAQARAILAEHPRERSLELALDGATGDLWVNPDSKRLEELRQKREAQRRDRQQQVAQAHEPAITTDGQRIEILANVGRPADAEAAAKMGAEGIGLLRTELLFFDRSSAPDEDQQISDLAPILQKMSGRPVVVRTLDIGGDKDVPYLQLPREANPFLGVRALRLCLRRPDLFQTQLRALLRAGVGQDLRIMFPMVSGPLDLQRAKESLEAAHAQLEREKTAHLWPVRTGIMVEIPSAAIMADELAAECDFFSIGTNDLTQYALAADRGNPELAEFQDALHPAVLRLIGQTADAGRRHGRSVAVCGEAAGDVGAALLMIGLGVNELSVNPAGIPGLKSAIRRISMQRLRTAARDALACATTEQTRAIARQLF